METCNAIQVSRIIQALDFHWDDYQNSDDQWGKIYLGECSYNWNQKWEFDGNELVCKGSPYEPVSGLRMDIYQNGTDDGTKVGVYQQNGAGNQLWSYQGEYCTGKICAYSCLKGS